MRDHVFQMQTGGWRMQSYETGKPGLQASTGRSRDPRSRLGRRRFLASAVAGLVLGATGLAPARASEAAKGGRPVRFDVLRNGSVIGRHEVSFARDGEGVLAVNTEIDIEVRILGVLAFEFRHKSVERWQRDLLLSFDSDTLDDDSKFFVRGIATPEGFRVTHRKGTEIAPPEIMVASYWRSSIARQARLIDPQRGRIKDQQLLQRDRVVVPVGDREQPADRYRLNGVIDGWVAYGEDGDWLAAELKKKGSDILYRRRA